jgi:hypothetical protein
MENFTVIEVLARELIGHRKNKKIFDVHKEYYNFNPLVL